MEKKNNLKEWIIKVKNSMKTSEPYEKRQPINISERRLKYESISIIK